MDNQVKQFEAVFGQGNVTANLMLREIKSVNELKSHESLIDIQNGDNFKQNTDGTTVGGDAMAGGKFIRLNVDFINQDGSFMDKKTMVHEIGHTGGLMHPWEFGTNPKKNFVNGNSFSQGVQGFSVNNLNDATNFMGYTNWGIEEGEKLLNPNLSQAQKINYFNSVTGKATQGQAQQIINNLYKGNLNSDKDIPKK